MKLKTILLISLTAIITLTLFQNSEVISMKFLWMDFQISKLWLIAGVFIIGLLVGLLWAGARAEKGTEERELNSQTENDLDEEDKEWLSK